MMLLHPGRDSIKEPCDTCLARINEECGVLINRDTSAEWRRQPSIAELRTFVEAAANDDADPYWLQRRAREIMGT